MRKINRNIGMNIFLVILILVGIELKSFLIYTNENISILDAHLFGLLHMGLTIVLGGIFLLILGFLSEKLFSDKKDDKPTWELTIRNDNCTNCEFYHHNNNVPKNENETDHYCTAFVKLGDSIEYECEKFKQRGKL